MALDLEMLRARRDRDLQSFLLAQGDVQHALKKIDDLSSGYGFSSRRSLLTGALRLTRSMAPEIAKSLAICREVLGYAEPVEVYVRADPLFKASAIRGDGGPNIVVLSSHLIEMFTPEELRFVIGHELGHMALDHFRIPMPAAASVEDLAGKLVSRANALKLYLWCRSAELSADRLGLMCVDDPRAAATGFFKLASGLSSAHVEADLDAYAEQVSSLAASPEARAKPRDDDDTLDCFSTHPYSPLRVRAIVAFSRSQAYRRFAGLGSDGLKDDEVEALIERDLDLMQPSYLEEKGDASKLMRRLLYCAGIAVAAANGEVLEAELRALRMLLGSDEADRKADVDAAKNELSKLVVDAREMPLVSRAQLVQHLTIIAVADGHVDEHEIDEMHRIARLLSVDERVVAQTLEGSARPLD